MGIEAAGDDLGGLPRADERARHDDVERDVEPLQRACRLAQLRHALLRQRPLRVVGPRLAALFGDTVTDQIELSHKRIRR